MEMDNIMSTLFNADKAPKAVGLYPHARQVGNLIFLSGVGPRQADSSDIPGVELDAQGKIISYDIEAQCHSVFQNVSTILASAGANWMDLVDVTVFLTNMADDFTAYNRIYAEYFAENMPCRTTVEVNKLPTPIAIELKCIAALPASSHKLRELDRSEKPSNGICSENKGE